MATRAEHASLFELTDHVCRVCFGRILKGHRPEGHPDEHAHRYVCTNCGAESVHRSISSLCACGMRTKTGRDYGLRCQRNEQPTPEFPSVVIAVQQLA